MSLPKYGGKLVENVVQSLGVGPFVDFMKQATQCPKCTFIPPDAILSCEECSRKHLSAVRIQHPNTNPE
jgi:hypothetical protein